MKTKPVLTFALFTFNQEKFVAEAVRGALGQTYSPLEIVISDDYSTDSTFEVIEKEIAAYTGRHTIHLNRNTKNIGLAASINKVMKLSRGQLIVVAAGDDISLPHRVEKTYQIFSRSENIVLSIYSDAIIIDENGKTLSENHVAPDPQKLTLNWLSKRLGGVLGCSHAWDRRVFDLFGPIDEDVIREDVVIPFRSALVGEIRFCNEPLVLYRHHSNNKWIGELERVRTSEELRASLLRLSDGNVAIYKNRLRDLGIMFRLYPEQQIQLKHFADDALKGLREMEDERRLLLSSSVIKRTAVILGAYWRGTSLRKLARWSLISFLPQLYLKHKLYLPTKPRMRQQRSVEPV